MASNLHLATRRGEDPPAPAGSVIRVLLADDHELVRSALRRALEDELDVEVVAEASDLESVWDCVEGQRPDVLVLELSTPGRSSIETIGQLRERVPRTQVVVLTMDEDPGLAQRALTEGAIGYLTKDRADGELPQALRAAVRGQQYLSPRVAASLEALHRSLTGNELTAREVEILRLIVLGHTSVEIARKLNLSPRTVETHRAHIHKKLDLATRAQLVGYALRRGLLGIRT
jgi:two-component system response regulator NreC